MLHKDKFSHKVVKMFFIFLPLFLSIAWLVCVATNSVTVAAADTGLKLSKSSNAAPIIIGLILFKIGYITFIYLMFKEEVTDFYRACRKKVSHKRFL
jgi:hypothetical protein